MPFSTAPPMQNKSPRLLEQVGIGRCCVTQHRREPPLLKCLFAQRAGSLWSLQLSILPCPCLYLYIPHFPAAVLPLLACLCIYNAGLDSMGVGTKVPGLPPFNFVEQCR